MRSRENGRSNGWKRIWWSLCLLAIFVSSLEAQKNTGRAQLERQRKAAQRQIEETSKMLKETDHSVSRQLNELNLLNSEIRTRQALLSVMQRELDAMALEQKGLRKTINDLHANIKVKQEKYAAAIRHLYKWRGGYNDMLFILSARNMAECVRRMRYLHQYSDWRRRQGEELRRERQRTEQAEAALEQKKIEHQALLDEQRREQNDLQKKQSRQKQLVAGLNKKKNQLQKELATQRKQARALDNKIQQLIEAEARKEAEAARKRSGGNKAGTAGGGKNSSGAVQYELTPEQRKLSGSFAQNKGKMPYPVNGSYAVVGRFGKQQQTQYVQTVNNGIILQTKKGVEACAVFDGEVNTVLQMPGYNISVIVKHGDYFSVYNNLSKVYVKTGQKIKIRDRIGLIYTDEAAGDVTKMDFQIWKGTQKQNPEFWLKR